MKVPKNHFLVLCQRMLFTMKKLILVSLQLRQIKIYMHIKILKYLYTFSNNNNIKNNKITKIKLLEY